MLAFGRLIVPERGVAGLRDQFYTPLIFSEMAEDRIVKFCAQFGPTIISLAMKNCPPSGRGQGHVTS